MVVEVKERKLEDRSFLKFHFPQGEGKTPVMFTLPFYENILVTETKRANLVRYEPIGRPSDLKAYTGAGARRFRVRFTLTLPHIQFESTDITVDKWVTFGILENKKERIDEFKKVQEQTSKTKTLGPPLPAVPQIQRVRNAIDKFLGPLPSAEITTEEIADEFGFDIVDAYTNTKSISLLYWWVNLIRSSVLNNSIDPLLGPPIVRLTHGLLYENVPCVATDYAIDIDPVGGYDLKTMMPRRVIVMMNLEEVRSGDFGEFVPTGKIKGDNVTGWEAIIDPAKGTIDPGEFD
jgi:hypothetical protein